MPALVRDTDTSSHVQNDWPLFTRIRMFSYPCPELDRGAKRSAMTMTVSGGGVTGSNYARSSRASHANWTNRLLPRAPQPPHSHQTPVKFNGCHRFCRAAGARSLFQCNAPSKRSPTTKHLNNNTLAEQLLLICRVHYWFPVPESVVFVLSSVDFVLFWGLLG